jgi:hypothetical protein
MKLHHASLCLTLLISGCVAGGVVPTKEHVANFKVAHVVAMESRPLGVPAQLKSLLPIQAAGGSISTSRGIALLNTIPILLEMPEASRQRNEASTSLQTVLDASEVWSPTAIIADEVAQQLKLTGVATERAPGFRPIPGVTDRSATLMMENWMAPIRAHYNDMGPIAAYRDLATDPSLRVFEVGISNYEIFSDRLILQVHLKMIDPSSGDVIGRARAGNASDLPSLAPLEQAFANNASRFKEVFSKTSAPLVTKCLTELGLIPQRTYWR